MAVVTLQVQSINGRIFYKDNVEIWEMPRVDERLQLGNLVGIQEEQNSSVVVRSIVHRIAGERGVIPPMVIVNLSEITPQIQDKIIADWQTVKLDS